VIIYDAEKLADVKLLDSAYLTVKACLGDTTKYALDIANASIDKQMVNTVEDLLGEAYPDLALIVAILVSTGWNRNDDIFVPDEVWQARTTPLHKPMNDNHQGDRILGHIVKCRPVDKNGDEVIVSDDRQLPQEFDLEVAGVLYKAFPQFKDRIAEILSQAQAGKMFVSMECFFSDFGYGILDPATGTTKLIERNNSTAFLTKHLRVYGGSGVYENYKIGRVLKNIIFGAQGFVANPANPESVIKVAVAANEMFAHASLDEITKGGVAKMEQELQELQNKLAELESKLVTADSTIVEKVKEIETKSLELESLKAANTELQNAISEATKRATDSEAILVNMKKDVVANERLAKLSAKKSVVDRETTLAELRDMTDEAFAIVLKYADTSVASVEDKVDDDTALASAEVDDVADFSVSADPVDTISKWVSLANALRGQQDSN